MFRQFPISGMQDHRISTKNIGRFQWGPCGSWCLVIFGISSLLRGQRLRPQGFCWWFTTWWWIWFPGRCCWKILRALEAMTVCHESRQHRGVKQSNWKNVSQTVINFLIKQERSKANAGFASWVTKNDMTIWDCASNTKQRPGSCCCMSWVLPRAVNSLLWFHPSKSFLVEWHLARFGWRCWWTEIYWFL